MNPIPQCIKRYPTYRTGWAWADPEVGPGVRTPLKNHKNIGFLSNTDPDPLKNHKATKPAFNFGHYRPASIMAFCWWIDDGPLIVVFLPRMMGDMYGHG